MNAKKTQANITVRGLYAKGYTLTAAAQAVGCSVHHLRMVLKGERQSRRLMEQLAALPEQELVLRQPVMA